MINNIHLQKICYHNHLFQNKKKGYRSWAEYRRVKGDKFYSRLDWSLHLPNIVHISTTTSIVDFWLNHTAH